MTPPTGTNTWKIYCDDSFTDVPITITAITPTDRPIDNQQQLYDTISKDGATKMTNGDRALLAPGTYVCGTCASSNSMFWTLNLFGSIICADGIQTCILDGQGTRRILHVEGTGVSKLTIKGIHFHRGTRTGTNHGGVINMQNGAKVTLEFCALTSCSAGQGGAIYIYTDSTLTAYTTSFTSNTATNNNGSDDILNSANLAIFDTCPEGFTGLPDEGENQKTTPLHPPRPKQKTINSYPTQKNRRTPQNSRRPRFWLSELIHERVLLNLSPRKRPSNRLARPQLSVNLRNLLHWEIQKRDRRRLHNLQRREVQQSRQFRRLVAHRVRRLRRWKAPSRPRNDHSLARQRRRLHFMYCRKVQRRCRSLMH